MKKAVKRNVNFSLLNKEKVSRIHEASLDLIENVGMKITGDRMLDLLHENGASTDDAGITKMSRKMVEAALETVPKELVLYTRDGEPNMIINRENQVYFGTHADQLEYLDPETDQVRSFRKADTKTMCQIADYLPNIDFILSVGMSSDVDPRVQSQVTFIETIKHFSKTINFSTNDIESLQEIIDIAASVAGGHDKLQEKPFIFNYCEPIPPLTHPIESTEKLYVSAKNRIPVVYMPYSMMGGTSPLSFAGALVQNNAEILAGLVMHQLVSPGAPFIYGSMPTIFDMKTTIGSYAAPEFHLLIAAASELANHYGIPFYGTAGCCDAKFIDEQSVTETATEILSTLLSKANIVHDVGVLDHCNSVSPEMVVLADEIIEREKHYVQGVDLDDLEAAVEVIKSVGHGGHYLNQEHTLKNFKKIWYPKLFSRKMENPDASQVKGLIKEKIKYIVENHHAPQLNPEALEKLEAWSLKYQ